MAADEITQQPLPEEITTAIAGVWQRHSKRRPTNGSTEIQGNVVRCLLPNSVSDFESGPEEARLSDPARRLEAYRRDAAAAVSKSTRCRVLAVISERDPDTDAATEIFVLDAAPKRVSFGNPGWIAS